MEPLTLSQILQRTGAPMFRVRDVETLKDYLNVSVYSWGHMTATTMYMYSADEFKYVYKDAKIRKYVLLSTKVEIEQMKRLRDEYIIQRLDESYGAALRSGK